MKRLHIHIAVDDLNRSIGFYSALFGTEPTVQKADYAKWMVEDPRVNFAISSRGAAVGLDHLGIQVDDAGELTALRNQMDQAGLNAEHDGETTCCYARSDKSWVQDPGGIPWEAYHTMGQVAYFNSSGEASTSACCAPRAVQPAEKEASCGTGSGCC